jgi:CDGSH iron-sulfur domain-containing protein 3
MSRTPRRRPRPATTDPVEIKVRESGPYRITGPVRLIDADGKEYDLEPYTKNGTIALCRCGGSTTKPFCDGRHSERGFDAAERAVADGRAAS